VNAIGMVYGAVLHYSISADLIDKAFTFISLTREKKPKCLIIIQLGQVLRSKRLSINALT